MLGTPGKDMLPSYREPLCYVVREIDKRKQLQSLGDELSS